MTARLLAAASLALALAAPALAEDGVHPDRIVFGQVAALEGPAAALGTGMNLGLMAAFAEINARGGVHGRQLELVAKDDGYEPERSVGLVTEIIASGEVFALIGPVGTPTSKATQPLAAEAGMPFIGPFTGAGFLRDPALGNVVNLRASYGAETEEWIRYLADEQGLTKIAILYQDDAFGRAGLDGVVAAMERRGLTLVAEGTYTRNTTAVKSALIEIRRAEPEAVVMVGAYAPCAEFIRLSRRLDFNPQFVNISFVGSEALAADLGADGEGVIVSQVVPLPWDGSVPVVAEYQAALAAIAPDAKPSFVSLEGYLVGRLAALALERTGAEPTRAGFLAAVAALGSVDVGGMTMTFGPGDNQGLDRVFLTRINAAGGFDPVPQPGT